jgi:hypothetical protein
MQYQNSNLRTTSSVHGAYFIFYIHCLKTIYFYQREVRQRKAARELGLAFSAGVYTVFAGEGDPLPPPQE